MIFKSNQKVCKCGRSEDHEHKTRESYCLHEKNNKGEVVSELFDHGYDGETDHIEEFSKEVLRDSGNRINYFLIKTIEI